LAKPVVEIVEITLGDLASISLTQIMISNPARAFRSAWRSSNGAIGIPDPDQAIMSAAQNRRKMDELRPV
jgi:hypothetical protein